jgi:hypothetical protein
MREKRIAKVAGQFRNIFLRRSFGAPVEDLWPVFSKLCVRHALVVYEKVLLTEFTEFLDEITKVAPDLTDQQLYKRVAEFLFNHTKVK